MDAENHQLQMEEDSQKILRVTAGWTSISATDALTMDSFGDYHLGEKAVLILSPKGRPVSLQLQDHHGGGYLWVPAMKRTYGVLFERNGIEATGSGQVDLQDARAQDASISSIAFVNISPHRCLSGACRKKKSGCSFSFAFYRLSGLVYIYRLSGLLYIGIYGICYILFGS